MSVDGVGAVNARGEVVIFVEADEWSDFRSYRFDEDRITLVSGGGNLTRTYGRLCVDTALLTGSVVVQEMLPGATFGRNVVLEAERGR